MGCIYEIWTGIGKNCNNNGKASISRSTLGEEVVDKDKNWLNE